MASHLQTLGRPDDLFPQGAWYYCWPDAGSRRYCHRPKGGCPPDLAFSISSPAVSPGRQAQLLRSRTAIITGALVEPPIYWAISTSGVCLLVAVCLYFWVVMACWANGQRLHRRALFLVLYASVGAVVDGLAGLNGRLAVKPLHRPGRPKMKKLLVLGVGSGLLVGAGLLVWLGGLGRYRHKAADFDELSRRRGRRQRSSQSPRRRALRAAS